MDVENMNIHELRLRAKAAQAHLLRELGQKDYLIWDETYPRREMDRYIEIMVEIERRESK